MNNYVQIEFQNISQEQSDMLVAQLSGIGFEGFEEEENRLKAFIPSKEFDEILLGDIIKSIQIDYTKTIIEETNWNQVWESSFDPVIVDDLVLRTPWVSIRAHFHQPIKDTRFEIIITPKMSFGTGHHATTYMMVQQMREIDFKNKAVLDFGTGTGVLAILAEKLGAITILAIDNDNWSIENAGENTKRNNCSVVELKLADNAQAGGRFDIILANINKNVILENLDALIKQLSNNGLLLLSGLQLEDEKDMLSECSEKSLKLLGRAERHNWLFLKFSGSRR